MPVEIKELVIRAVVQGPENTLGLTTNSVGADRHAAQRALEHERELIIAAAVKEALRILRTERER